jgi:hypothetical protein
MASVLLTTLLRTSREEGGFFEIQQLSQPVFQIEANASGDVSFEELVLTLRAASKCPVPVSGARLSK